MTINTNPPVFPSPASQTDGITLFDLILCALIAGDTDQSFTITSILDVAKHMLLYRNIAIENLDNYKSMDRIIKELEDNDNK